jgi:hypothetical protein
MPGDGDARTIRRKSVLSLALGIGGTAVVSVLRLQ